MKTAAVVTHIVEWLREQVRAAGGQGLVVGVSGGIDSAVTSCLAARTELAVLVLSMPIHQAAAETARANQHIDELQTQYAHVAAATIDLTRVFDHFAATMPTFKPPARALALANARARLRMTTLYYHASCHGYLVAGTGNKVEDFGVGFYTKYGDGGVDLSPIADLTKTQVTTLGAALKVNAEIMRAPPTDGLWGDDRTDETQLGASYAELEWAMAYQNDAPTETNLTNRQHTVLIRYRELHAANRHKMEAIPVCRIPWGE